MSGSSPAAPLAYTAGWKSVGGLWLKLAARSVVFALPGVALVFMFAYLFGLLYFSFWGFVVMLVVAVLVLLVAHQVGGMVILPAQNNILRLVRWLWQWTWVRKLLPGLANVESVLGDRQTYAVQLGPRLVSSFNGQRFNITTPDRAVVDGVFFKPSSRPMKGAIVYVNGNGELFEMHRVSTVQQYLVEGVGVTLFNYRGVSQSVGLPTRDGLVIDLASIVDMLVMVQGLRLDQVCLVGHSLGGAVASEVAAHFPGVHICHDRSFSRLSTVAQHILLGQDIVASQHWFHRLLTGFAASLIKHGVVWEMDSVKHWLEVDGTACHKWYASAARDQIITPPTQLSTALEAMSDLHPATKGKKMILGMGGDPHNRPWSGPEMTQHLRFLHAALDSRKDK